MLQGRLRFVIDDDDDADDDDDDNDDDDILAKFSVILMPVTRLRSVAES